MATPLRSPASPAPYDSESIVILSGVEAVRKCPSLYIGDTGTDGLHRLVFELIENSVDEHLAGACTRISVALYPDGSCSVTDDGRGLPIADHPVEKRPAVEVLLTRLHSGAKFSASAYGFSAGLHGLGLTCVNALAQSVSLEVRRNGRTYRQEFRKGVPQNELAACGPANSQGTSFHFLPDREIFGDCTFDYDRIARRLRELAFLNPGLQLRIDDGGNRNDEYCFVSGIRGLIEEMNRSRAVLHADPVSGCTTGEGAVVDFALQWTASYATEIVSYVNSVHTSEGGTHVEGFERALLRVLRGYIGGLLPSQDGQDVIARSDAVEGLTAVVSINIAGAEFDSQTKNHLVKREASAIIEDLVAERLLDFMEKSPQAKRAIIDKVTEARRIRLASRGAGIRMRRLFPGTGNSLDVYRKQFGIRSKNWHDSCRWLTDPGLLQAHAELCRAPEGSRLLDVCCGSGIVGASFGERVGYKIGLDITPEMRRMAGTRLNEVREGSVYDIPFDDASFDVVVTREVIHLLPQAEQPLREILRVLRPGGQLILGQTVPYGVADAAWTFQIFHKKQPLFCNNFMAEDLANLFAGIGFQNVDKTEYLLWEPIDLWIDTHETTGLHRQEIRDLYYNAPDDVREIHPFEVAPDGRIRDQWRWCIFSARKPA